MDRRRYRCPAALLLDLCCPLGGSPVAAACPSSHARLTARSASTARGLTSRWGSGKSLAAAAALTCLPQCHCHVRCVVSDHSPRTLPRAPPVPLFSSGHEKDPGRHAAGPGAGHRKQPARLRQAGAHKHGARAARAAMLGRARTRLPSHLFMWAPQSQAPLVPQTTRTPPPPNKRQGLRTLVVASKIIPEADYVAWDRRYQEAARSFQVHPGGRGASAMHTGRCGAAGKHVPPGNRSP